MTFADRCLAEAVALHDFLRDWLTGALPRTPEAFARFADALASDIEVFGPDGSVTRREALLTEFEAAHGALAHARDRFEIEVRAPAFRFAAGDIGLATYEEWHFLGGKPSARLSSALYRARADAPLGVEWVHIHETWAPGLAPAGGVRFPQDG